MTIPFTLPIPIYHCYKRVHALKIRAVVPNPRGWELHFDEGRFLPVEVPHGWMAKHLTGDNGTSQLVGGYAVWNEDGYMSWLPAAAFEAGYTLVPTIEWAKSWYEFTKGWPGGPSEVEAALDSRDAEIERLRHALELAGPVMDAHAGPSRLAEFVSAGPATQAAREAFDEAAEMRRAEWHAELDVALRLMWADAMLAAREAVKPVVQPASEVLSDDLSKCQRAQMDAGKPYPKTCPVCGLSGKCKLEGGAA